MCGIVGFISKDDGLFPLEKHHFMHFGLSIDTLRGFDSTGVINVSGDFNVKSQHSLLAGDRYVHSSQYQRAYHDSWCKIGHNRAATKGSVKIQNAHPFTFGAVTLVHNGTLAHRGSSIATYDPKLEVDSMQIALALSKVEPEDAKKVLETIDGSFALVWTDERDKSVNMCRNSDRPLHFCFNGQKNMLWFMSDGLHLKTINKSLQRTQAHGGNIYSMDRMQLLKYKKGSLVPEVQKFHPFVRPVYTRPASRPKKETALERAVRNWSVNASNAKAAGGSRTLKPADGSGLRIADMRVEVNGKTRKLPLRHAVELHREYDLKPNMHLEFKPIVKYKQENGRFTVLGDFVHPEWGDSEWDAIIYNVRPAMVNAYWGMHWVVNPVGVSRPHQYTSAQTHHTVPSVICDLVTCDWGKYEKELEAMNPTEGPPDPKELTVQVGDREIPRTKYQALCDEGCAYCTMQLEYASYRSAILVHNGNGVLCGACVKDLTSQGMDPERSLLM